MKYMRDCIGRELKWIQPHTFKQDYLLMDGAETAGALRFRSIFGSLAEAESADGCWSFKRVGFWQTRVTIRACGSPTDLGQFRNKTWTSGGTLELADGRRYPANTNFWLTEFRFTTEAGQPLVDFRHIGGLLHMSSLVTLQPAAAALDELPWLAALGWYLTIMIYEESAAVTVATTTAIGA